jgi:hypothetical protein
MKRYVIAETAYTATMPTASNAMVKAVFGK